MLFRKQQLAILVIIIGLLANYVECQNKTEQKVTLLSYYGDFIDTIMGLVEDISLDFIVPSYQYIKSHVALKYMFFTLLIVACVFNLLGNFNHLFKSTKKAKFVANQDIPKDSKQLQKQIRILRETVSLLKQQALNQSSDNNTQLSSVPVQNNAPIKAQNNISNNQPTPQLVQLTLDPSIEQKINKNQQSIDFLKTNLMKIVEIQKDLQNSILESQREVAQNIQCIRTNKPSSKSNAPHSSQLDSQQSKPPHSHSRQSSTSFLEELNDKKLTSQINDIVPNKNQEKENAILQPPIMAQTNQIQRNQVIEENRQQQQQQQQQQLHQQQQQQQQIQQLQERQQHNQQMPPPSFAPVRQSSPIQQDNNNIQGTNPNTGAVQSENKEQIQQEVAQNQIQEQQQQQQGVSAFGRVPPPVSAANRPTAFGGRQPPSMMNKKQPVRNMPNSNAPVLLPPKQ